MFPKEYQLPQDETRGLRIRIGKALKNLGYSPRSMPRRKDASGKDLPRKKGYRHKDCQDC